MKLFYSYCHSDEEFREYMERYLSVLKQSGAISEWCDRKILPGQTFVEEIDRQMDAADLIVLLISSDFLASPACVHEMTTALKLREDTTTAVIPVIVRPCDWKHSKYPRCLPFLPTGYPLPSGAIEIRRFSVSQRASETPLQHQRYVCTKNFRTCLRKQTSYYKDGKMLG